MSSIDTRSWFLPRLANYTCNASSSNTSNASSSIICTNTCNYASDSDCDDGGPGTEYNLCSPGTDCQDCGHFGDVSCSEPTNESPLCHDRDESTWCATGNASEPGWLEVNFTAPRTVAGLRLFEGANCTEAQLGEYEFYFRAVGSSTWTSCPAFSPSPPPPAMPPPLPPPSPQCCSNAGCVYAFDNDCDDGGPGAEFALCDIGTDCNDCGNRCGENNTFAQFAGSDGVMNSTEWSRLIGAVFPSHNWTGSQITQGFGVLDTGNNGSTRDNQLTLNEFLHYLLVRVPVALPDRVRRVLGDGRPGLVPERHDAHHLAL